MKVQKVQVPFQFAPVSITIESLGEAQALRNIVGCISRLNLSRDEVNLLEGLRAAVAPPTKPSKYGLVTMLYKSDEEILEALLHS